MPNKACPCCQGALHQIGEDVAERLDLIPAQLRVLVTRRPKYACRACEEGVVRAPAPARLIESGLPTKALVARVLVAKYADHCPLYRQVQIFARQGVNLDRSTLADWVGPAAFLLCPVHARLLDDLNTSAKLFADETTLPVLDPGRGRTKTGQLWAYARDDRPWGGVDPPGVAYVYAPDRKAEQPSKHLAGFKGVLQVDGYGGYRPLAEKGEVKLAFCWAHLWMPHSCKRLARIGRDHDILVFAGGSHPAANWRGQSRTQKARYDEIADDMQMLARRDVVCVMHIHVEVPEPDRGVDLMRRFLPYTPTLLALSASSPFWEGRRRD